MDGMQRFDYVLYSKFSLPPSKGAITLVLALDLNCPSVILLLGVRCNLLFRFSFFLHSILYTLLAIAFRFLVYDSVCRQR